MVAAVRWKVSRQAQLVFLPGTVGPSLRDCGISAKREGNVRGRGQFVFNTIALRLSAALGGLGLAYLPEDAVAAYLTSGRLVQVLKDWCPPFAGYHLYYPSRRQTSPAFALVADALRYRGPRHRSFHLVALLSPSD
ncbi:LysR substrate-binding domain-containing protein [Ensifer canadensis]